MSANGWEALRDLRATGRRPTLPVVVTTKRQMPWRLQGVGCLTVLHEAGTKFPVEHLAGLEVIFLFERCELASHVWRLAKSRGVKFNAQVWCECAGCLSCLPMSCESARAAIDWSESEVTHA